jgi:DMSO/TMAO reductase YedYZ molybdopterin-dependent catalytic subunit
MQVRDELPKFARNSVDLQRWRLRIEGRVERPLSLRYEDITKLPKVSLTEDFRCLEGWIVRGIVWEGVKVSLILKLAKLKPEVTNLKFSSADFSAVLRVGKALENSTILALGNGGKILDDYHGGPVRLVFHGQECYESVKSLDRIQASSGEIEGTAKKIALSRLNNRIAEMWVN